MAILAPEEDTHMAKLTSAALAAHELGTCSNLRRILFVNGPGEIGEGAPQPDRSIPLIEQAWKTYSVPSTIGLLTPPPPGFIGRTAFSGRFMAGRCGG